MHKFIIGLTVTAVLGGCGQTNESNETHKSSPVLEVGKYASAPELPIEETGVNMSLPVVYPPSYVFAHNLNFYSLLDGNINIVDVAADTREYKGMLSAGQLASFVQSKLRNELYVAETFYSRGTRGDRTDVFTIYDTATLKVKDEIVLPDGKRGLFVTQKGTLQLLDNDKYALLTNFTPAMSVSVIDLEIRELSQEIPTPGCITTFPLQGMAFGSLCGDGKVVSYNLQDGQVTQSLSEEFNDIDNDPMFLKSAQIGTIRYFPTFTGNVQPIDVSGAEAVPMEAWSLVTVAEREQNWRPSGWQVITSQHDGQLYVLMQKNAREGSHKEGGSEIWVFDVTTKKKTNEIKLEKGGLSIEATRGVRGHLVVTNLEMGLEVYGLDGSLIRTITVNDTATPFVLHASK